MPERPFLFISLLIFSINYKSGAQAYQWAAGIKVSKSMGLSVVYSPETPYSIEGVIGKNFWTGESSLSIAGRYHHKFISRGLNFYGGGGLYFGMYDDPEIKGVTGLLLNGGAEVSLGKTNLSFNISPVIGVGNETVNLKIGSDITVRHIIKKHPRRKDGILEKLGLKKSTSKKSAKKKSTAKKKPSVSTKESSKDKKILDFDWLKKKKGD